VYVVIAQKYRATGGIFSVMGKCTGMGGTFTIVTGVSIPKGGIVTCTVRVQYISANSEARSTPRPSGRRYDVSERGRVRI